VVRWELRPRLFLRTSEFLWQEGHTAHVSEADAAAYARRILHEVYEDFMVEVLAMPVLVGRKTASERFAGAINTLTCEAMMRDGKALQMATSHELGTNFARAFDISYLDDQGTTRSCWTTSWGSSTRMVGGLIMGHGDDDGLVVPPRLAPIQVVVLVVKEDGGVAAAADQLVGELRGQGVRTVLDDKLVHGFGRRSTDWELKGVPVRVEVGPRDLADDQLTLVRRDRGEKQTVPLAKAAESVAGVLADVQHDLLAQATKARDAQTSEVASLDEAAEAAQVGVARLPWDLLRGPGEARLAEQGVTVRCLQRADGSVPDDDGEDDLVAYVARAY
jgi:prolyl-tRNA synthetase